MHVYVIEAPHGCKIGVSKSPNTRLRALQTQGGFAASRVWVSFPCRFARKAESSAHAALAEQRTHGEWFDVDFDAAVETVETAICERADKLSENDSLEDDAEDTPCCNMDDYIRGARNFVYQMAEDHPEWLPDNFSTADRYCAKDNQSIHRRIDLLCDEEIAIVVELLDELDSKKRELYELLRARFGSHPANT